MKIRQLLNRDNHRRHIIIAVFSLMIAGFGGYLALDMSQAATYAAPSEGEAGTVRGGASKISGSGASGGQTVVFGTAPTPPACTKDTSLFSPAGPIEVTTASPGFKKVIDPPAYYNVNGYTAQQVRDQMNACTPITQNGGEFDAITWWWAKYVYNTAPQPSGKCKTKDVAVGIHITSLFPKWASSPQAAETLEGRWQTYITNLTTHENGHRDINLQHAQQLLTDIQNYPETDCSTIINAVNTFSNNALADITKTNDDYDTQTQHGLTQGTRFP